MECSKVLNFRLIFEIGASSVVVECGGSDLGTQEEAL